MGFLFTLLKLLGYVLALTKVFQTDRSGEQGKCRHCPWRYPLHLHLTHVGKGCQSVRDSHTHWNLRLMEFIQTGPKVCDWIVALWDRCSGGSKLSSRGSQFFLRSTSYLSNWTRVTLAHSVFIQHQHHWRQLCVYLWISTYNSNKSPKLLSLDSKIVFLTQLARYSSG